MDPPGGRNSYRAILEHLVAYDVDFIIVGGIAAVLHGAPIVTFDLDLLRLRTPTSVVKLLTALEAIDARCRTDARGLKPTAAHLSGPGHQLLRTSLGVIDVLGSIGTDLSSEKALPESEIVDLDGLSVRVLGLRRLLRLKDQLGRDKDRVTASILRTMLESGD